MKEFFKNNIEALKKLVDESCDGTATDKIIAKCAENVIEAVERQLGQMSFFRNEASDDAIAKMEYAPLTNSGCESRQAQLDVRVKFSGGSAPFENISNKQIVAVNKFLLTEKFEKEGAKELFKWARSSEESKAAKALES